MYQVLVTSGDPHKAYVICKALHRCGLRVHIGDSQRLTMAACSRYCSGRMTYTDPDVDVRRFMDDISRYIEREGVDIVLPTMDETYVLAAHADRLPGRVRSLLPSHAQIAMTNDKSIITGVARELGIDVPETWEVSALLHDLQAAQALPYPVIIKPKIGKGGWATARIDDVATLQDVLRSTVNPDGYMVQRFIDGDVVAACAIYRNGRCMARDSYLPRSTFPPKVGPPTTRTSVHFGETLDSLIRLLDHLAWNGVCEVDYVIEKSTGKSYLLDVNPRFWASIAHNIAAGVNYPYYYCKLALGDENIGTPEAVPGTTTCWLAGDLRRVAAEVWAAKSRVRHVLDWIAARPHYNAYDDWDMNDPLPFLCWWGSALTRKVGAIMRRRAG